MRRILLLACALALTAACQPRMPLGRIEAAAAARNWCLRDGHPWGDVLTTTGPGEPDADGRRWWTVTFKEGPEGPRTLLVNADSGWVKKP